ncbi:MAG: cobalamin-dependent protein, partial [Candidatus Omnitrophota bacterium]
MFFKMAAAEKADILLVVTPPFLVKMPHIGVGYLSSFLKNKGYSVSVADLSMQLYKVATCEQRFYWQVDCVNSFFHTQISDSILDFFKKEIGDFVNSVISSKIRVIGFSVNIISIDLANKIAQMIKEKAPDCLIVFGGPGVYFDYPRSRLQPIFCDVCVIGEGELALLKIMDEYYGKGTVFGRTCLHPGEGAQE